MNVDDYIETRPEDLKRLIEEIRYSMLNLQPLLQETLKWKTPFYQYKGHNLCYLSTKVGRKFVQVGFVKGTLLQNHHNKLIADGRKSIRALEFIEFGDVEEGLLLDTIYEAMLLYR